MTCASWEEELGAAVTMGRRICAWGADGCSVGVSQIPQGMWAPGGTSASGSHAWTWVSTDSVLCVLTNDESMTGVRWKQRTRAGRLPGSHGDGGSDVVACWKEAAKSRRCLPRCRYLVGQTKQREGYTGQGVSVCTGPSGQRELHVFVQPRHKWLAELWEEEMALFGSWGRAT